MKEIDVLRFEATWEKNILFSKRLPLEITLSDLKDKIVNIMKIYLNDNDEFNDDIANELINNINMKEYISEYTKSIDLIIRKEKYFFKKYELCGDIASPIWDKNLILYRIKALVDIPKYSVKKGDVGGYVENIFNLSQDGDCWIGDTAKVFGNAYVENDAHVGGIAYVFDNAHVCNNASVDGGSHVCDNAEVSNYAIVTDNAKIQGNAKVYDKAKVMGLSMVSGNARVFGCAELYQNSSVGDSAYVYDNAVLEGDCVVKSEAKVHGEAFITNKEVVGNKTEIVIGNKPNKNGYEFINELKRYMNSKELNISTYAKLLFDELNKK